MNGSASNVPEDEQSLFKAPSDLLCPILHTLMRNPVLTSAGNVYEEDAIRSHLRRSKKDPLSNQILDDDKLIPVFVIRSRAKEYAANTAQACIQRVLDPACDTPARYLRRACEVTEEAGVLNSTSSLTPRIVTFSLQHRSSMHDIFLLIQFATDLANSGNKMGALAVFSNLLRLWTDRLDQTAVIKRCLQFCWLEKNESPSLGYPGQNVYPADEQVNARRSTAANSAQYNIQAILDFMQQQRGLNATEFVAILTNLGVSRRDLIQICKGVLYQHAPEAALRAATLPGSPGRSGHYGSNAVPQADFGAQNSTPPNRRSYMSGRMTVHSPSSKGFSNAAPLSGPDCQSDLNLGADLADFEVMAMCSKLGESLALLPRLLELLEEDVKEETTSRILTAQKWLGEALGLDAAAVNEISSVFDESSREMPRGHLNSSNGRKSIERYLLAAATVGAVLIPGGVGRLLAALPGLFLLTKN